MKDPSTAKYRAGYIISYTCWPITWASKMQTKVVLSTTESEYVHLSVSLRIDIAIMNLLKKMKEQGVDLPLTTPVVYCKLFEDIAGAIHLAKSPKMHAWTRHTDLKYYHFWEGVKTSLIAILPIDKSEQPVDSLTKPLNVFSSIGRLR